MGDRRSIVIAVLALVAAIAVPAAVGVAPAAAGDPVSTPSVRSSIVAGSSHSCTITPQGGALCWGRGTEGQLGSGSTVDSGVPVPVSGLTGVVALAAGDAHTCAVLGSGGVRCWGINVSGELGNGSTSTGPTTTPVTVVGLTDATAIDANGGHTCAVRATGGVVCWGRNDLGQLGNGGFTDASTPTAVSDVSGATAVATGSNHSCAVVAAGAVRCWGANADGQLGDGTTSSSVSPVSVSGLTGAVVVDAGAWHTCAVLGNGEARCWGRNQYGALGDGTTTGSSLPVAVAGLTGASALAAGYNYTCAVTTSGVASCWGYNGFGTLGDGTVQDSSTPVPVGGVVGVTAISGGDLHACAVLSSGGIRCWGAGSSGQLGDGTSEDSWVPLVVAGRSGATTFTRIAAGFDHSCARITGGGVACWGLNSSGELGNGTTDDSAVPVLVPGLYDVTSLSAGMHHTCARRADATVVCWGANDSGQLGNGVGPNSLLPVPVAGLTGVVAVSAGGSHTCAVLATGGAQCWGANGDGQLGDGTTLSLGFPHDVASLSGATAISAGYRHTCALVAGGAVSCWGRNSDGQLGNGTTTMAMVPTPVSGLTGATVVAAAGSHTCARVSTGGGVRCWGANGFGQLGDGTTTPSLVPVAVSGLSGTIDVATAYDHACSAMESGSFRCWGSNAFGGLGDGTTTSSSTPVEVTGLTDSISVATGYGHSCALDGPGIRCWGRNASGQLGDASTTSSNVPVVVARAPWATRSVTATAGSGRATVSWSAPLDPGSSPITGYVVTPYVGRSPQASVTFSSTATTQTITGLANGTAYSFAVAAVNAGERGPQSPVSTAVTPSTSANAGFLRVVTSPAVPSQITVDGAIADSWGLKWVKQPAGSHTVCFSSVEGYTAPACQTVTVTVGQTTTVTGTFVARGFLRVVTSPAVNSRISVDGVPRNNWGLWTDVPVGSHEVCFGAVAGYTPPPCQTVNVAAGSNPTVTGTFAPSSAAGPTGLGFLRVTTSPARPSQITVDGSIANTWGLDWLQIAPGSHTVCFSHVEGWTEPGCSTVTVTADATTVVTGTFVQRGYLKVDTSPAVAGTITIDGVPADDWGDYTDRPVGTYHVCFGDVPGTVAPPCQDAVVTAGTTTAITGVYT